MPCYRVKWPNNTVDIVFAEDDADLFLTLDSEADPYSAIIEEIEPPHGFIPSNNSLIARLLASECRVVRRVTESDLDRAFGVLYPIMSRC